MILGQLAIPQEPFYMYPIKMKIFTFQQILELTGQLEIVLEFGLVLHVVQLELMLLHA
jgi:hypothetical protein